VDGVEVAHDRYRGGGDDVLVQDRQDDRQQAAQERPLLLFLGHAASVGKILYQVNK
jgi:hypothetical protein